MRGITFQTQLDHPFHANDPIASHFDRQEQKRNKMSQIQCEYCQKWFRSERGLGLHLRANQYCSSLKETAEGDTKLGNNSRARAGDEPPARKKSKRVSQETLDSDVEISANDEEIEADVEVDTEYNTRLSSRIFGDRSVAKMPTDSSQQVTEGKDRMDWLPYLRQFDHEDNPMFDPDTVDSSDDEDAMVAAKVDELADESEGITDETSESGGDDSSSVDEGKAQVDRDKWDKRRRNTVLRFKKYVKFIEDHTLPLTQIESTAIKIMNKLIRKKAPLDTYDEVMDWHLRESGLLKPWQSVGDSPHFITRQKLLEKLKTRYHMAHQYARPKTLILPHCRSKIQVWRKRAQDNILSLLTDPRWNDDDWSYFGDDPFAIPPENLSYIEDINTGEAFMKTYERLITDPTRQILATLPLYIDGAVTGQFDKLQVTAMKMSIGLLNRKARDKEYAWRVLGFVTNYAKEDHRGKKMFVESGHIAAHELYCDCTSDEDEVEVDEEDDKAADYHAILSVIMESVKELIEDGMVVDLYYKGKLYKNCELFFFIPFVKCDGDEADKLCCAYRSRGDKVKQLCRYCQCPTDKTDDPKAKYPFKTEPMMKRLYEKGEVEKLRKMSQNCVPNAFHGLRFGLHNDRGVHGACPFELLHAVLLGIFKYSRDCLFEQLGETSQTAKEVNALAQEIGKHLQKQSDRNKPRTKFSQGILKGKLMAKEYTGVMLVIAAMLQTEDGKELLTSARKKDLRQVGRLSDWVLLIETLLQWEAYLNLPRMEKSDVQRLKKKHQFLLFLLKKVAARNKGMGFKVMKFHAVLHLAQDIEMFGVPMVVDTGSNESHHKTTKIAAKLTQKDVKTFEKQTSDRLDDFHVLELALAELEGRPLADYFEGYWQKSAAKSNEAPPTTGGMMYHVFENKETKKIEFSVRTRMIGRDKVQQDDGLLFYILQVQNVLSSWIKFIPVCAQHTRSGQIFRSHPNFRGKGPWRDWVMVKWTSGDYPSKIWGFLDLSLLPEAVSVKLHDDTVVRKGVWAVIESANDVNPPAVKKGQEPPRPSEMFKHIRLEAASYDAQGLPAERKFYLVDVETFKQPLVVIPNMGTKCDYLMMTPKDQWAEDFKRWIHAVHKEDEEEMED